MTVLDVLKKARALVKRGWTQGGFAEDKEGLVVTIESPNACRFCAEGAVMRSGDGDAAASIAALRKLRVAIGCRCPIAAWNDYQGRTKQQVLAAFDKAIEQAKGRKR